MNCAVCNRTKSRKLKYDMVLFKRGERQYVCGLCAIEIANFVFDLANGNQKRITE